MTLQRDPNAGNSRVDRHVASDEVARCQMGDRALPVVGGVTLRWLRLVTSYWCSIIISRLGRAVVKL